jgi:hypothetical protein
MLVGATSVLMHASTIVKCTIANVALAQEVHTRHNELHKITAAAL